jgi:AcrR family transcriptional regulator
MGIPSNASDADDRPADQRILDATLRLLARDGLAGVSMRAVAREAGVAVGLANYHFDSKHALICAALRRMGEHDAMLVAPAEQGDPVERLRQALRRAVDPAFLEPGYLSLRLQLWSLAGVSPDFAEINRAAQLRYRTGLADLIAAACPELDRDDVERRAADILIEQNGIWLTTVLAVDQDAVERATSRCEQLAFSEQTVG